MAGNETVRVAMVQSLVQIEAGAGNVERALDYLEKARGLGAELVCFPETYPGPWTPPLGYDPLPDLCRGAKEHNLYVIAGLIEPVTGQADRFHIKEVLIGANGEIVGEYRRTTPRGPWLYQGSRFWDFHYQEAAALPVFETPWGKIGIAICSEVYVPEVSRILALQGAEIIFLPAGVPKPELWHTWRTLIFARAIENLCFTATCQNLFEPADLGLTMICSPEQVLVESIQEGVFVADCDLARLRLLRAAEDTWDFPGMKHCKPGIFDHWYRPELHADLLAKVGRGAKGHSRGGDREP
jgi:predicted amidohydrolase